MIIPAAALNCKLKGKYIQYRDQCEKKYSEMLYNKFEMLKEALIHVKTKCNGDSKHEESTPQGALLQHHQMKCFKKHHLNSSINLMKRECHRMISMMNH